MEAADHRMDLIDAGQLARAFEGVDHARVAAACQHDQAFVLDVQDDRLVVVNPRSAYHLPSIHATCDGLPFSNTVVRSICPVTSARPPITMDGPRSSMVSTSFRFEVALTRRDTLGLVAVRLNILCEIGIGMENDRQSRSPVALDEAEQAAGVIGVAMT